MLKFNKAPFAKVLERGNNNFDLIRLVAALFVLFGHSYWIYPAKGRVEPILQFTGLEYSGSLAVFSFFLTSGILVSASFERQRSIFKFVILRISRIWPALVICSLVTVFILGMILSPLPYGRFFFDIKTIKWLGHSLTLFGNLGGDLPGLFERNHVKGVVNGSLWTLPLEIKCYLVVILFGITGALESKKRAVVITMIVAVMFSLLLILGPPASPLPDLHQKHVSPSFSGVCRHGFSILLSDFIEKPTGYSFYPFPFFIAGILIYIFRKCIIVDLKICLSGWILYLCFKSTYFGMILFYPTFVFTILVIAQSLRLSQIHIKNDYSYGVYLYAFPVQQVVASLYPDIDNYLGLCVSIPITILFAIGSWHLIERPCLSRSRQVLQRRRSDVLPAAVA